MNMGASIIPSGSRYPLIQDLGLKDLFWLVGPDAFIMRYLDPLGDTGDILPAEHSTRKMSEVSTPAPCSCWRIEPSSAQ